MIPKIWCEGKHLNRETQSLRKVQENKSQKTWSWFSLIKILTSLLDTEAGKLNQSFRQRLGPQTQHQNYLRSFLKIHIPSPSLGTMWICSVARNLFCFALVCLLSFPSDSHPQLSFRPPEPRRASWGSNHLWFWDSSVPRSEPFPLPLTQPGTFYCFNITLFSWFFL